MTFTSLRNPPITRRSKDRSTSGELPMSVARVAGLVCILAIGVLAFVNPCPVLAEQEESPVAESEPFAGEIPTEAEIDERLSKLKAASADSQTTSPEEIQAILTVLGSKIPEDVKPYAEPATDPSQLSKINSISPFRDPSSGEELPEEIPLGKESFYLPREIPHSHYNWQASDLFSNPLYFEDVNLERYGYSYPFLLQPFMSVGKFSTQLAILPYQMVNNPVRKHVYHLGYYRPGEWAPRLWYQVPFNLKAATVQAGAVTGMIFLIP